MSLPEANHTDEYPFTEPLIVQCLVLTGAAIDIDEGLMRFVGWTKMPVLGGEMRERRICVRFAMPIGAAFKLREEINRHLRLENVLQSGHLS